MNHFCLVSSAALALAVALLLPATAGATTDTYDYTGDVQSWVVPAGVTSATFDLYGAEGGTAYDSSYGAAGLGGRATATLAVTPGETIEIRVGGQGGASGGYNGGGAPNTNGPGGGGGATDIRQGGGALADRTLVAGGGGGSGACSGLGGTKSNGGAGGGLVGGDAPNTGACFSAADAGLGGTQSSGGTGGGSAGTLGQGGAAAPGGVYYRGGGGGGYYGGGGASYNQGAGGGSGYGPSGTTFETGVRSGNGAVTVTYLQPLTLTAATSGNGSGSVTSTPSGIDCHSGSSSDCTKSAIEGSDITLQASADAGSTFTGWSGGGCSGTGSCVVTLDAAKTVTADFTLQKRGLSVTRSGSGTGTVTSSPAGIDCGTTCAADFDYGTEVTLQPSADAGSTFTGWSGGGCSGTGSCTVKLDAAASVDAAFTDDPPVITSLRVTPSSFSPDPTPVKPKQLGATLEVGLSEKAQVRFRVRRNPARKSGNPGSTARVFTRELEQGESSIPFSGTFRKTLKPGRYQVIARATDSAGQRSKRARTKFRVKG